MKPSIGIVPENLETVAHSLNTLLADEFVLYTKTRNAHWNIEGPDFYDKHKFFEAQYEALDEIMDEVAERIRMLGHYAPATLQAYLKLTHLSEHPVKTNDAKGYMEELLSDHESIIIFLRENINRYTEDFKDLGTSDFITGLLRSHEKMARMLRSHFR